MQYLSLSKSRGIGQADAAEQKLPKIKPKPNILDPMFEISNYDLGLFLVTRKKKLQIFIFHWLEA